MVNSVEEFKELIKGKKVVVDFYASWCGPCKMFSPIIDEVANEMPDVKFLKVDIDTLEALPKEYEIMSIPTVLIFENGVLSKRVTGYLEKDQLIEFISR